MVKSQIAAVTLALAGLLSLPMSVGAASASADGVTPPGSSAPSVPAPPVMIPLIKPWCC
jgi:hypothetical protein